MKEKNNSSRLTRTIDLVLPFTALILLTSLFVISGCSSSDNNSEVKTESGSQESATAVTSTSLQQPEKWRILGKDGREDEITLIESTSTKMVFRDKVGDNNNATQIIEIRRISLDTKYFVGQLAVEQGNHPDQVFYIELENIGDGCYLGIIGAHATSNSRRQNRDVLISKPGVNCQL